MEIILQCHMFTRCHVVVCQTDDVGHSVPDVQGGWGNNCRERQVRSEDAQWSSSHLIWQSNRRGGEVLFSFFKQKETHLPWPKKLKASLCVLLGVLSCGCSVHSPDSVSCGPEVSMQSCYCSHIVSQLPSATPLTLRCVIPASFCPSVGSLSLQNRLLCTWPPALPLGTPGVEITLLVTSWIKRRVWLTWA